MATATMNSTTFIAPAIRVREGPFVFSPESLRRIFGGGGGGGGRARARSPLSTLLPVFLVSELNAVVY